MPPPGSPTRIRPAGRAAQPPSARPTSRPAVNTFLEDILQLFGVGNQNVTPTRGAQAQGSAQQRLQETDAGLQRALMLKALMDEQIAKRKARRPNIGGGGIGGSFASGGFF